VTLDEHVFAQGHLRTLQGFQMTKFRDLWRLAVAFAVALSGTNLLRAQCPQIGWSELAGGTNGGVLVMMPADDGDSVYVGGYFTTAGNISASGIAKWDGATWSSLGTGTTGSVRALATFDDSHGDGPVLFAGGGFSVIGGVVSMYIARWDGALWSRLSDDWYLNQSVSSMAVFDDGTGPALYVGGYFTSIQGVPVNHIFKWNGATWSSVGGGLGTNSEYTTVSALMPFDDGSGNGTELFATGNSRSPTDSPRITSPNGMARSGLPWEPVSVGQARCWRGLQMAHCTGCTWVVPSQQRAD